MSDDFRKESRKDWVNPDQAPTTRELQLGCLQRIADASELMARDHQSLVNRERWAQERADRLQKTCDRLARSNAALRGHLKRMKARDGK